MIVHYLMRSLPISVTEVGCLILSIFLCCLPHVNSPRFWSDSLAWCRLSEYLPKRVRQEYTNQTILMLYIHSIMKGGPMSLFVLQPQIGKDLNLIWMVMQCQMRMMMVALLLQYMYVAKAVTDLSYLAACLCHNTMSR